eukprot:CAMPEP_0119107192 /NCGR_PEP_ID=MMETSP1180-20130426/9141_1 /TAXON_ID=3052 ORGANISM="Chlamydomonas cf sp, Strain CCMP681" /NCGR_SAMPLE_ID=MMETSP1180 /ASSEMBLY_ACC=CAM_ASM_000741 /LENGTH=227 /DNA_ID=CAMNT_0007092649 /DNA_START=42 /DNA_END=725 /DNA_ORIENTATION=+
MAIVINKVEVKDSPCPFTAPFSFDIEYECECNLRDDLEWKMIYVGSADSESHDQVLDSVLVGPVYQGSYKFTFEGNPPDHSKLPDKDILGVTVILLTCSYQNKEFIRIGWYVNNEYTDEELKENPPDVPIIDKLTRSILAEHPRVTRFPCDFDNVTVAEVAETADLVAGMQVEDGDQLLTGEQDGEAQLTEQAAPDAWRLQEGAETELHGTGLDANMSQQQAGMAAR